MNLDLLKTAHAIAPEPDRDGTSTQWAVHHAARALAAYATFRRENEALPPNPQPGSRPDLGLLMLTANSALAAAVALTAAPTDSPAKTAARIWTLTSEAGAVNGEFWEEWLIGLLDLRGVNPALVYPYLDPADFSGTTATPTTIEETRRYG